MEGWVSIAVTSMVYYIYIATNRSKTLYTGVTNNLIRRAWQHKKKQFPGFTRAYNIDRLVYYESFGDVRSAIQREKQIKGWVRAKEIALIESMNPEWLDLTPPYTPPSANVVILSGAKDPESVEADYAT